MHVEATYSQDATKQDKCAIRKRAKQYRVQDGQLYRVIRTDAKNGDALSLYIKDAKTTKQSEIINGCHIGPTGNHVGRVTNACKDCAKVFLARIIKGCEKLGKYLSCHLNYCQHLLFFLFKPGAAL